MSAHPLPEPTHTERALPEQPPMCHLSPARAEERSEDFRRLLGRARAVQRPTRQHLRLTLSTDGGLDIAVLAHEKECCEWFEFTLEPTTSGTVLLDIVVPGAAGAVRGPVPDLVDAGTPEEVLDRFADEATALGVLGESDASHPSERSRAGCGCSPSCAS